MIIINVNLLHLTSSLISHFLFFALSGKSLINLGIGPILDDRLKEKVLKP